MSSDPIKNRPVVPVAAGEIPGLSWVTREPSVIDRRRPLTSESSASLRSQSKVFAWSLEIKTKSGLSVTVAFIVVSFDLYFDRISATGCSKHWITSMDDSEDAIYQL